MKKNSGIDYSELIASTIYDVVKKFLKIIQKKGIINNDHFYICFLTSDAGVIIPEQLKKENNKEMTIVLQHEFSNLQVNDDYFSVELNFSGQSVSITVPYRALKLFYTHSQSFNLELSINNEKDNNSAISSDKDQKLENNGKIIDLISFKDAGSNLQ